MAAMPRHIRGSGSVYLRGNIWWIQYYARGRARNESSHSTDREEAERQLKVKVGEVAAGRDIAPEKATIADLCGLVLADYSLRKLRDAATVKWRYEANIKPVLGPLLVSRFNLRQVRLYVDMRREQKASDATINRELAIIRRGFSLGREEDPPLVSRVPKIPKLEEDNARQGFLEPEQYEKLLSELPERLKALFVCAYHVGTRKGELRKLQWPQVDLDASLIRLEARQTKGKRPRTLPIYGDMRRWLEFQAERRPEGCPWVFNHYSKPVGAQLRGWAEACERAGFPGLLFHDLRRSAVRNMKRAGVGDVEAMRISGHKTRAIFDRYNIVDETDVANAAEKLTEYFAERKKQARAKLRRVK